MKKARRQPKRKGNMNIRLEIHCDFQANDHEFNSAISVRKKSSSNNGWLNWIGTIVKSIIAFIPKMF